MYMCTTFYMFDVVLVQHFSWKTLVGTAAVTTAKPLLCKGCWWLCRLVWVESRGSLQHTLLCVHGRWMEARWARIIVCSIVSCWGTVWRLYYNSKRGNAFSRGLQWQLSIWAAGPACLSQRVYTSRRWNCGGFMCLLVWSSAPCVSHIVR